MITLVPVLAAAALVTIAPPPDAPSLPRETIKKVWDENTLALVEKLAGFGTRHTLSAADEAGIASGRGIGAARVWIKKMLEEYARGEGMGNTDKAKAAMAGEPRLTVAFESFDAPKSTRLPEGGTLVNVVATLPGAMPESAKRRVYIVGHYDSRNADAMDAAGDAPGANDDASGVAAAMEAARVLAGVKLDSTVVFLLTAGEEQGLLGAQYHAAQAAARARENGETIIAVLNNDIVGDPRDHKGTGRSYSVRVFSEGLPRNPTAEQLAKIRATSGESDSPSRQLARFVEEIGSLYEGQVVTTALVFRQDRFLRGGDHIAFNDNGFPAVRFTTMRENYDRQHANVTTKDGAPYGDIARYIDSTYLGRVTRLNVAAAIHLANAPSTPANVRIVTAELGNPTTLRWQASPEGDVAGYEVVYRNTIEPMWTGGEVVDVGNVTEITLDKSKDDLFFGVRAYDHEGYRSVVGFAGAAKE